MNQLNEDLVSQSDAVKSCKGRAWISVKSPEGGASFNGVLIVDRSQKGNPRLYLEALDPFGGLHHLFVIEKNKLKWLDFDQKVLREGRDSWRQVPMGFFPNGLLGLVSPQILSEINMGQLDSLHLGAEKEPELFFKTKQYGEVRYQFEHLADGNQFVAQHLESKDTKNKIDLEFSHFENKKGYFLPNVAQLSLGVHFEIKVSWRERRCNEEVNGQVFSVPEERVKGFQRVHLQK